MVWVFRYKTPSGSLVAVFVDGRFAFWTRGSDF